MCKCMWRVRELAVYKRVMYQCIILFDRCEYPISYSNAQSISDLLSTETVIGSIHLASNEFHETTRSPCSMVWRP